MTITESTKTSSPSKTGNGAIRFLKQKDVLVGRGGESNHHIGNHLYQKVIMRYSRDYAKCSRRKEKTDLSWQILRELRSQGFRFLKKEKASGRYSRVGDEDIRKKISQRLRERALEVIQDARDHRTAVSSSDESSASTADINSKAGETANHDQIMSMEQVWLNHPRPGPTTETNNREQEYEPLDMRTAALEGLDAMLECWAQDAVAGDMPDFPLSEIEGHFIPSVAESFGGCGIYQTIPQQHPTSIGHGYVSSDEEDDLKLSFDETIALYDECVSEFESDFDKPFHWRTS